MGYISDFMPREKILRNSIEYYSKETTKISKYSRNCVNLVNKLSHNLHLPCFSGTWRTSPADYVNPRSLEPRFRLKAACLNMVSVAFFIIVVNRTRLALSCKWLSPKYCSTIYRFLEICLLRCFSYSINLAVVVSFLMIPSAMLFKLRKSLLDLLHPVESLRVRNAKFNWAGYALSAYTLLMGSSV